MFFPFLDYVKVPILTGNGSTSYVIPYTCMMSFYPEDFDQGAFNWVDATIFDNFGTGINVTVLSQGETPGSGSPIKGNCGLLLMKTGDVVRINSSGNTTSGVIHLFRLPE